MCGIAGYLGARPFDPTAVFAALDHRGPDGRGYWSDGVAEGHALHFVHTRLKILDLTEAAAQPMSLWSRVHLGEIHSRQLAATVVGRSAAAEWRLSRDSAQSGLEPNCAYTLIFNGEIYNFRELRTELVACGWSFTSSGDTEVLLKGYAEWGTAVFRKCDGMFAAAVFDRPRQELVLARDQLGIKPLYVGQPPSGGIVFASEVRAVVATGMLSADIDREAVHDYLRFGSFQEPATIFSDIRAFPAGTFCRVTLRAGEARLSKATPFWSPWEFVSEQNDSNDCDAMKWEAEHAAVLAATVEEQLVSDVPVGVFLSGGVDSSVLLEQAVVIRGTGVTAFTLAGDVTAADESTIAARTCANLGVRHFVSCLTGRELETWVADGLDAMDQPSWDGINTYLISRAARRAGLVAVLGGTGADELHGAYGHAAKLARFIRWVQAGGLLTRAVLAAAGEAVGLWSGRLYGERLRLMLDAVPDPVAVLAEKRRFLVPSQIRRIWRDGMSPVGPSGPGTTDRQSADREMSSRVTVAELEGYLRNTLLRDSDWATMANHQELRVPYLGRKYVELMLRMPATLRCARGGRIKPLLAARLSRQNRDLALARKRGFSLDYAKLLHGTMGGRFRDACQNLNASLGFTIDPEALLAESARAPSGKPANRLWGLLALGRYVSRIRNGNAVGDVASPGAAGA